MMKVLLSGIQNDFESLVTQKLSYSKCLLLPTS